MSLVHLNDWPLKDPLTGPFRQMQRDMNRILSDFCLENSSVMGPNKSGFSPRIDVHENEKGIVLTAELPGIPKENVKIDAQDNVLTLSGETAKQEERKDGTTHISERFHGKFMRAVGLPPTADLENVQAKFDNGILHVNVPKKVENQPRRITIQ